MWSTHYIEMLINRCKKTKKINKSLISLKTTSTAKFKKKKQQRKKEKQRAAALNILNTKCK